MNNNNYNNNNGREDKMNLVNEGVLPPDELDDRDERREQDEARGRETVADVIAEMRDAANSADAWRADMAARVVMDYADRVEIAARRERDRAVEHATRHAEAVARDNCRDCVHNPSGKNYEGGNAAAMREACQKTRDLLVRRGNGKCQCVLTWDEFDYAQKMLRAALSAPARNCDLYATYAEAAEAHKEYATAYIARSSNIFDFPMEFDEWLFALAAERKGESNESK